MARSSNAQVTEKEVDRNSIKNDTRSQEETSNFNEVPDKTDNNSVRDEESTLEKIPYPKSVFFIVSNEFCERFSFYGMRTILILYLTDILLYTETEAKMVYHTFSMFVYFFPVLGAIISDSWLGKFRTIFYVSMIYACGSILLSLTSIEPLNIPQKSITIVSLLLIAIGTGGIKPCVAAFGGDQFVLPQQELQLTMFFSLFYFAINSGSLISTFVTPILRNDVHCFDNTSCFPLAFAVPGILMVISIFIFVFGKPLYKMKQPKGNVFLNVIKCMSYAVVNRKKGPKVDHWLDRSEEKYGTRLVTDIKSFMKVLVIFLPLPIFWALYDQQGSGWTFQAVRMDGNIGFYTILPDQMQVINPLLILAFIPLFSYGVYPLLAKCNLLTTPLQKMVCGGFLAAIAFAVSACLSIFLEATYPVLPEKGEAQVRIYDTTNACNYYFTTDDNIVPDGVFDDGYFEYKDIHIDSEKEITFHFNSATCENKSLPVTMEEEAAYGIYLYKYSTSNTVFVEYYQDDVNKSTDGYPLVRTLSSYNQPITYINSKDQSNVVEIEAGNSTLFKIKEIGEYYIESSTTTLEFKLGGTYSVLIDENGDVKSFITVTNPNSVNMLWLLIQYFIITAGEIMFSVTGLEFAYSQAPISMKSVVQSLWLLTTAFGNLLIVIIESLELFEKQSNDFFLYTGLMVVDMLLFMWLAIRYKYVTDEDSSVGDETELNNAEDSKKVANGVDNPAFEQNN